jgi:hypothetical protein
VAGFVLMLAIGRQLRSAAMPVLIGALYLTPALLLVTFNAKGFEHDAIWILPLLGLLLSDRGEVLQWSLAGALAMAAHHVVGDRGDHVADRLSARRPTSRCGSSASSGVSQHEHRHRAVAGRSERHLLRPWPPAGNPPDRYALPLVPR